jgi:hypothetical protein
MRSATTLLLVLLTAIVVAAPELAAQTVSGPRSRVSYSEIPPTLRPDYRDNAGNGPFFGQAIPSRYYGFNPSPYWDYMGNVLSGHIRSRCRRNDGFYVVEDPVTNAQYRLRLQDLQRESLSRLDPSTFIIGSRFETTEGTPVLVDFLLKPGIRGQWYVAKAEVYKINGEARYEYEWNGKKWMKVLATAGQ